MDYNKFLESKTEAKTKTGFVPEKLNQHLFDFQKKIVTLACEVGRYAIFADCGLGKTLMQLAWAEQVVNYTNKPVLILAPLAVAQQTINEGLKFGITVSKVSNADYTKAKGIYLTNYEQLEDMDTSNFSGVVLDESSIIKNFTGAYRNLIIERFKNTPFKLPCTATPSPNDELELGNHAEFLNVMTSQDMRAMYFTTDKSLTNGKKWRLKKHSIEEFYKWVATWSCTISKPSDLGFSDDGYNLPSLNITESLIKTQKQENGMLFNSVSVSAITYNKELKNTMEARLNKAAEIANSTKGSVIIWIKQNEEGKYLRELIPDAIEVKGSDKKEVKERYLIGFGKGEFRVLITKAKIAQFGLNYQNCNVQIFPSLDFSFEGFYQCIRRSYRFGQTKNVEAHIITTDTMGNVLKTIKSKIKKHEAMQKLTKEVIETKEVQEAQEVQTNVYKTENFTLINGDCVAETRKLEDNSIDYTFFSPPFGALYVFSSDPRDMSNVKNNDEFLTHFEYLVHELLRVTKPGRLVSIHMMQSTTLKGRDGFYSIVDFRGDLIRLFQKCGFYFHAENMIRKDPKTAAIRTKNRQLMHGTTKKDSSIVRPGLADYILTFRKPGENQVPIQNNIPFELWCKIAEPVWIDIEEGDTITYRDAREDKDERHITPTQLKTVDNCLNMWCNKDEVVFSPFSGVASEGYQALITGRKYIGIELKESYFKKSINNCHDAELLASQQTLF